MRIRTKVRIGTLVFSVVVVSFTTALTWAIWNVEEQQGLQDVVDDLSYDIFQETSLVADFFLHKEERARDQFALVAQRVDVEINEVASQISSEEQKSILIRIKERHDQARRLFGDITQLSLEAQSMKKEIATIDGLSSMAGEEEGGVMIPLVTDLEQRVEQRDTLARRQVTFLLQEMQGLSALAKRLNETVGGELRIQAFVERVVSTGAIAIILLLILVIFWYSERVVLKPLLEFRGALERVRKGEMSVSLATERGDEIGDLQRGFDTMVSRLKFSQKNLKDQNIDLEKQNTQLAMARDAMTQLVDDLQAQHLKAEEERSKDEAILGSIGDGIVATDQDGHIVVMNKAAEEMLGAVATDVFGKPVIDVVRLEKEDGAEVPVYERPAVVALSSGQKVHASVVDKLYFKKKDGVRFPVQITVTPYELNKKIVGSVIVFRDISHEYEVDKAKSEFVSLASHQLRTPLSTTNWYTEMLLNEDIGELNEAQKEYLQEIYKSNQRLVGLVNALLNVSRIDMGTFSVTPKIVDIIDICKTVVKENDKLIKTKKLAVTENYDEKVPRIKADPDLVRIVLQNLVSNAVKYTPESGSVTITIELHVAEDAGKRSEPTDIRVTVADTGYGIPLEEQKSIFSKLFRADNVKQLDVEGTGLGLYVTKSIIDHSGGSISFVSKEKEGTTFSVTLPITGMREKKGTRRLQ